MNPSPRAAWRARSRSGSRRSRRAASRRGVAVAGRSSARRVRRRCDAARDALGAHDVARPRYRRARRASAADRARVWPALAACADVDGGARTVLAGPMSIESRSTIRASCATSTPPADLAEARELARSSLAGRRARRLPPRGRARRAPTARRSGRAAPTATPSPRLIARAAGRHAHVLRARRAARDRHRHDPAATSAARGSASGPGDVLIAARARARAEPVAAARRSRTCRPRSARSASRSTSRRTSSAAWVVRRAVVADHDVRPHRGDPAAHHGAVRARRRSLGPGLRAPVVRPHADAARATASCCGARSPTRVVDRDLADELSRVLSAVLFRQRRARARRAIATGRRGDVCSAPTRRASGTAPTSLDAQARRRADDARRGSPRRHGRAQRSSKATIAYWIGNVVADLPARPGVAAGKARLRGDVRVRAAAA